MKDFPREGWWLIFLNALFQGGRLTVGAISSLYFLHQGFSLSEFAQVKSVQAVTFLIFDVPLGLFLTYIGSYRSMLLGVVCGFIGALGYIFSTHLVEFMVSEAFLALSLSIWPSALGSSCMIALKGVSEEKGTVERFFHTGDSIANVSIVIAGLIGAWLYKSSISYPYLLFALIYLLAICLLLKGSPSGNKEVSEKGQLTFNFGALVKVWPFILMMCASQFALQPVLHYWQPFFKERFEATTFEISVVFIIYSLTMSGVSSIYGALNKFPLLRHPSIPMVIGAFASLYFFALSYSDSYLTALVLFSFLFAFINVIQVAASVLFQKRLTDNERINCSKQSAFIARLAMLLSLSLFGILSDQGFSIGNIFFIYGALSFTLFGLLTIVSYFFSLKKSYS